MHGEVCEATPLPCPRRGPGLVPRRIGGAAPPPEEGGSMELLTQLLSGAAGGNIAGLINKARSFGPLLNTVLGALGGLGGGQIFGKFATDLLGGNATAGRISASAVVGALVPLIASLFKKKTPATATH